MKTNLFLASLFLAPVIASAGFKVPSKVYDIADLEKAKTEAQEKGKPISFFYSDKNTTCPLCVNASETIIKELSNKTVMVYVPNVAGLPSAAREALTVGRYIPKVAVLNAALDQSLGSVTYEAIKADPRKAFREVEKAIRQYKK